MTTLSKQQREQMAAASWQRVARASLPDVLMIVGAALLSFGAWQVYEPAGFIVGGVLLLASGIMAARSGSA